MKRTPPGVLVRGVVVTTSLATSALSHVGWWLEWHTRSRAAEGCRPLESD